MNKDSVFAIIPPWTLVVRTVSELLLRPLFPRVIVDPNKAIQKARLAAQKGEGLVIVFTHFSLRDAMEVTRSIICIDPVLKNREVINPLAYHQYNRLMDLITGKFFHSGLMPIVNHSTLQKRGYEHLPKGKGLNEFVVAAGNLLTKGGIVSMAANATRSEKLDIDDPQKPVGYLIASLQAKGVRQYGFLIISFAVKNARSYSKKEVGGFNIGKTYMMRLVNYYSLDELLQMPEVNGKVGNVDVFVRREIAKVTPKEYL